MQRNFLQAVKNRRTFYSLQPQSQIAQETIEQVIEQAIEYAPTAFNSQSSRVVLLFADEHKKLWQIVEEELEQILPPEAFANSKTKIDDSFASGYGSILFFEDMSIVKKLQEQFPLYKENFPVWSNQSNAMLQFIVWTALTDLGLGASLQHYSNLIEQQVKTAWNTPDDWFLVAQMPFGQPLDMPQEKEIAPLSERFFVYK